MTGGDADSVLTSSDFFSLLPPYHSPSVTLPTTTMSAEDIFEGAVGIDLGTTYSYALPSLAGPPPHLFQQLCRRLAKRPSRNHR
jgi:hypothetical protein